MCLHPDVIDALAAAGATPQMIAAAYRAAWAAERVTPESLSESGETSDWVGTPKGRRSEAVDPRVGLPASGHRTLVVGDTDGKEPSFVSVYVIGRIENDQTIGPCKIGVASNPRSRLSAFQTATPFKIDVVAEITLPATLADVKLRKTLEGDNENYERARKIFGIESALAAFHKVCAS